MFRYTVTAEFDQDSTASAWLRWLRDGHVQEVIEAGARSAEIVRLDAVTTTFEVRYVFSDREAFTAYQRDHAGRLQAEGLERFPESSGVRYERSTGEIEATFTGG